MAFKIAAKSRSQAGRLGARRRPRAFACAGAPRKPRRRWAQRSPAGRSSAARRHRTVSRLRPISTIAAISAKLTFELSAPVDVAAFVLADPDRVIVDAPQVEFLIDPEIGKAPTPPIIRRGRRGRAKTPRQGERPHRVIPLRPARKGPLAHRRRPRRRRPASFGRAANRAPAARSRASSSSWRRPTARISRRPRRRRARPWRSRRQTRIAAQIQAAGGKPIVMIDPGHGGIDRGATVNGLIEKDLVLDFAKALAARLEADGRYQPVLTRDDDSFIPLGERVRMARDQQGRAFRVDSCRHTGRGGGRLRRDGLYRLRSRVGRRGRARRRKGERRPTPRRASTAPRTPPKCPTSCST